MRNTLREKSAAAVKSLLAFILAVCMVVTALPEMALAASNHDEPGDLKRSTTYKSYVKLSKEVSLYSRVEAIGTPAAKAAKGSILQLYTEDYYTVGGQDYLRLYYNNKLYNVLRSDVQGDIMLFSAFDSYVVGTYWPSIKETDTIKLEYSSTASKQLVGDYRVHAAQKALQAVGYAIAADGDFGSGTFEAVKAFQTANGLTADGILNGKTMAKLFAKAKATLPPSAGGTASSKKGDGPEDLTRSSYKSYIVLSKKLNLYSTTEATLYPAATAAADSILQMYTEDYYTYNKHDYYRVYYNNKLYNVLCSDVSKDDILSQDDFEHLIKAGIFSDDHSKAATLEYKSSSPIVGSYMTHAVQLALKLLDISVNVDGDYTQPTANAVKTFQQNYNNKKYTSKVDKALTVDGKMGATGIPILFDIATGKVPESVLTGIQIPTTPETDSSTGTGSGTGSTTTTVPTTGTLKTTAKVNLRNGRSTTSLRLGSIPQSTTLTYYDRRVESSGTWYKVIYKNNTGWILGTYVTTDLTGGTVSNLLPTGSIRTTSKLNMRKEATTNSLRLGSIPENTIVSYSETKVANGITWYKVRYSNETGWIMGTYTSIYTTNTTTTTSQLLPTGSIRTTAKVNLREKASTSGKRLGSVPENVILTYLDTSVSGGVTWYKVSYKGETGWIMGTYTSNTYAGGTTTSTGSVSPNAGTLKTTAKVNLRKKASTTSTRLGQVPAGVNLSYTTTSLVGGVTWYYVTYNGESGWLMGTFVSAKGNTTSAAIGTVTITKAGTRLRDAANGNKTGVVLAKGTTVSLIASPVTSGGYTWYNIRTSSGAVGFVRGDCASLSSTSGGTTGGTGSSTNTTIYNNKVFAALPKGTILFKEATRPASGYKTLAEDTVLMLASETTYTKNSVEYISLYYRNETYNTEYANVKNYILDNSELAVVMKTLYETKLTKTMKQEQNLVGDVQVYALQLGLQSLGLYTGNLDGKYGSGTYSAVRNLQRQAGLKVDGECGTNTWNALAARIGYININGGTTITPEAGTGTFGAVTSVQKLTWDFDNKSTAEFPKNSYATVMDVETKKVFNIYRWAGGNHADCVPATEADTKIMCEIVGFPYNSSRPTSAQKNLIINDDKNNNATYTWPDFKNSWGGGVKIGSKWDRRPVLVNIGGKVYPASIYGWPHGYLGESSGVGSMKLGGKSCSEYTNYYGMMCVHFYSSTTHSGTSGSASGHLDAINKAWSYAQSVWPNLVK